MRAALGVPPKFGAIKSCVPVVVRSTSRTTLTLKYQGAIDGLGDGLADGLCEGEILGLGICSETSPRDGLADGLNDADGLNEADGLVLGL